MLRLRIFFLLPLLVLSPATASAKLLFDLPPVLAGALNTCIPVSNPFTFSGYQWHVKSGHLGPGPNNWAAENVCIDRQGRLHLKITEKDGRWYCSEVWTEDSLGFGTYQFQVIGRTDTLDPNVVLGMFNYGTADCIQEIDIELGALGTATPLHYSVYPDTSGSPNTVQTTCAESSGSCEVCDTGKYYCTKGFDYTLTSYTLPSSYAIHSFTWGSTSIRFRSLREYRGYPINILTDWTYTAGSSPNTVIPQSPLPVHINYWLFRGEAPINGKIPPEIIIRRFSYTAYDSPGVQQGEDR